MALSTTEKKIAVTVEVDAKKAISGFRQYKAAAGDAKRSTEEFGEGLEVSNARIINQRESLQKAIATFDRAAAAQNRAAAGMRKGLQSLGPVAAIAAGAIGGFSATALVGAAKNAATALYGLSQESLATQDVFRNLAFAIEPARRATHGFVGDLELATYANQAAAIGLTNSAQEFAKFAGAVQKLAARANTDTAQMFNSMIAAVGRGSTEMLDNAGIVLKTEQAHEIYARQLGKTRAELTETEEAEAFRRVAMQKIFEAAEQITITTDGAAAATKRYKVELENLKTAALGGEDRVVFLRDAFDELSKSQGDAFLGLHGNSISLFEVRKAMRELGVDTSVVAGLTKEDLVRGFDEARGREERHLVTLAANHELTIEYADQLERVVRRMDESSLSAQTLGRALSQMRVAEAAEDMRKLQGALDLALAVEEANVAIALLDANIDRSSKRAQGHIDRFKAQRAEFEAALAATRRSAGFATLNRDDATARAEFDSQLQEAQRREAVAQAQAQHNAIMEAGEREHLQKLEEARKAAHDATLQRLAAETKAREDAVRHQQQIQAVVSSLSHQSMGLAEEVAVAVADGERQRTLIMQGFAASRATVTGIEEQVKAAAAFASFNFVQGALHQGASALAFAKAGMLAGGVIGPGAGSGGGSAGGGGGSASFLPGGVGEKRDRVGSGPPVSRASAHAPPKASGSKGPSVVQNFYSYLPADEKQMGMVLRKAVKHSEEHDGDI